VGVKVVDTSSLHEEKIFEVLTLEISGSNVNNRAYLVSNIYRSPTPLRNLPQQEQNELFISKLEQHLNFLSTKNSKSYVFMDVNINLLKLCTDDLPLRYYNIISGTGFAPLNFKASSMQKTSKSLIDHALSNDTSNGILSGSLITDISDHFPIFFIQPKLSKHKNKPAVNFRRLFNN
jgi:hypothetical protein